MRKFVIWLLISTFCAPAFSLTKYPICADKYYVYFSNGIQTSAINAAKSRFALEKTILPDALSYHEFSVDGLYHKNDGAGDLAEVFLQKANEKQYADFPFADKVRAWFDLPAIPGSGLEDFYKGWKDFTKLDYQDKIAQDRLNDASGRVAIEAQKDAAILMQALHDDQKILIVSHSQGNLSTNNAYEILMAMPGIAQKVIDQIALVAIASAAAVTYQDGVSSTDPSLYVTLRNDAIINGLGILSIAMRFLQPLPPNHYAYKTGDAFGHNFVATYLEADPQVRKTVVDLIASQSRHLLTKKEAFHVDNTAQYTGAPYVATALDSSYFVGGHLFSRRSTTVTGSVVTDRFSFFCGGIESHPVVTDHVPAMFFSAVVPPPDYGIPVLSSTAFVGEQQLSLPPQMTSTMIERTVQGVSVLF